MKNIFWHFFLYVVTLMLAAHLVPGFKVANIWVALSASLVISLLNILVLPILVALTLPITVLTLGFFLFVLNALVLIVSSGLVPGFVINGFVPALLAAIVMAIVGVTLKVFFSLPVGPKDRM